MSRIYGNIEEIDSEKIKKFFNNRGCPPKLNFG